MMSTFACNRRLLTFVAVLCCGMTFDPRALPAREPSATAKAQSADASVGRAVRLLDLRELPRVGIAQIISDLPTYTYYSAKARVSSACGFHESELTALGWQVIPDAVPSNETYCNRLLHKEGYYLRLTVRTSRTEGEVGISVSHLGNIDLMQLPQMADAKPLTNPSPVYSAYLTDRSIAEAAAFCRQAFIPLGWHEYRESPTELPSVPHAQKLDFVRQGTRIIVSLTHDLQNPTSTSTNVAYMAHQMLPYDVPIVEKAERLLIDTIRNRAGYFVSVPADKVVQFLRTNGPTVGLHERRDETVVDDEGEATMFLEGSDQIGIGVAIFHADGKLKVKFDRTTFASPQERLRGDRPEPQPLARAAERSEQPAEESEAAQESSRQLRAQIEETKNQQLKAVQEQLAKSGVTLPNEFLSILDDEDEDDDDDDDEDQESQEESRELTTPLRDDSEQLAKLPRLKSACTIVYDGQKYNLGNVLAIRKHDNGDPVIMFAQSALNAGLARWTLARNEDVSILDLTGAGSGARLQIELATGMTSYSCFVDGLSSNQTSSDIQTEFLVSPQRVRGTVVKEAEDIFGKKLQFQATFDEEFLSSSNPGSTPVPDELVADQNFDIPVPEGCQETTQEKSKYKQFVEAKMASPMSTVVAFYNKQLPQPGWKFQSSPARGAGERKSIWNGPDGTLHLSLRPREFRPLSVTRSWRNGMSFFPRLASQPSCWRTPRNKRS